MKKIENEIKKEYKNYLTTFNMKDTTQNWQLFKKHYAINYIKFYGIKKGKDILEVLTKI